MVCFIRGFVLLFVRCSPWTVPSAFGGCGTAVMFIRLVLVVMFLKLFTRHTGSQKVSHKAWHAISKSPCYTVRWVEVAEYGIANK